jgi:hypothetical protein
MPLRLYRCPDGHEHEAWYPGDYPRTEACPHDCMLTARSVPAPFAGAIDKELRAAAFAKKGQVPWERGMDRDADRHARYRLEDQEKKISAVCEDIVRNDPTIRPD